MTNNIGTTQCYTTTWVISLSGCNTRWVLTFCALRATKACNATINAGFFILSQQDFWWWVFTSVNPTCCLLPTTDRFLDQRGLKAGFSPRSHTVFLTSAASLLFSFTLDFHCPLYALSHFQISLFFPTLNFWCNQWFIFNGNNRLIVTEKRRDNNYPKVKICASTTKTRP